MWDYGWVYAHSSHVQHVCTLTISDAFILICCFPQDPFLIGVNCYAEVFLEVQDVALSGVNIDPKAVTVYPTTRVYGGVAVQKEFLTGKPLGRRSFYLGRS